MKKILALILVTLCCFTLFGCEEDRVGEDAVKVNGNLLVLREDVSKALEVLGEPVNYSENKSCLYDGYDKSYEFDGVTIVTYPDGDVDRISSIRYSATDSENAFKINIGDTADRVLIRIGENRVTCNKICYIYENGVNGIAFYLDGDIITEIEIYNIEE